MSYLYDKMEIKYRKRGGSLQKSQRLIQLIMRINAKQSFTVRELADEFGLSTRTITRDLLLSQACKTSDVSTKKMGKSS